MSDFVVYPKGFIGSNRVEHTKIEAEQNYMTMGVGLFKTNIGQTDKSFYCTQTQYLYDTYYTKELTMPIIVDILNIAKVHIGDSPLQWIKKHNDLEFKKYGMIGRYNLEFIHDCLISFIQRNARKMSIQSWEKFIVGASNNDPIDTSIAFKALMSDESIKNSNTVDLITDWAAMTDGARDLLASLQLMYGK